MKFVINQRGVSGQVEAKSSGNGVGNQGRMKSNRGTVRRCSIGFYLMEATVVEALGDGGFEKLVAAFYERVKSDDVIGPMYPEQDWEGAERRLVGFLRFRFGVDDEYIRERGHPRLRQRHIPFSIGEAERDRWLLLMGEACDEIELQGEPRELLDAFFAQVADFMRNRPE